MNTLTSTLLLAGSTGLIGRELQQLALAQGHTVHALVRRPGAVNAAPRLHAVVVDFAALPALPRADAALCALGTTIKVAGSQAAFRAVDFDAVLNFARAAQAAGVRRFGVVSALGASASSGTFYNRVKGQAEEALTALGFETLVIAQPSLLMGDREALGQASRPFESLALKLTTPLRVLLPASVRPIHAQQVARALLQATLGAGPGRHVLSSAQMQAVH